MSISQRAAVSGPLIGCDLHLPDEVINSMLGSAPSGREMAPGNG
jgi:hypothetical protein